MASAIHSAFEEKGEIVSQHSESIWCSLLHYLLNIEGARGVLRDLESLLTGSQSNGCLLLAEVFLSGKFVWDSSESTFSLGWWDLQYVLLTAQNAWDMNLLMLQKFAFCFPFSRTPRSASLPEQHCLYFHPMKCCPPSDCQQGCHPSLPLLQRGQGLSTSPGADRLRLPLAGRRLSEASCTLWSYPVSPFPL